jgi:hypothetical protein
MSPRTYGLVASPTLATVGAAAVTATPASAHNVTVDSPARVGSGVVNHTDDHAWAGVCALNDVHRWKHV